MESSILDTAIDISGLPLPLEAVPLSPVAVRQSSSFSNAAIDTSVSNLPTEAVPLSPVVAKETFSDVLDVHLLDSLEEELLTPSCEVTPSLSVCANIHQAQFFPFWQDVLKCSPWHTKILKEGYRLDFIDGILPGSYDERNNRSARLEPAFVRDSLDSMSSSNILDQVLEKPTCVNPLTVSARELSPESRKLRLCWDGSRFINPKLKKMSVKLSHFPKAAEILYHGDYQVSMDLKSFYYHLMIYPPHRTFLGIAADFPDGSRRYYQYNVLPFGLAPAAAIMTRLVKPIISYLASLGIRMSIYLDDSKVNAATKALAWEHYQITKEVFRKAGFVISAEKSDEFSDVSQQKLYLGFIMCSVSMTAKASDEKLSTVMSFVRSHLSHDRISVKDLAKIAGRIAALRPALGHFVLLVSRSSYALIEQHVDNFGWSGILTISTAIKTELQLFLDYATTLNGYPLLQDYRSQAIQDLIPHSTSFAGDASAVGVCAYSLQSPSSSFFQDAFSEEESRLSSGHRELLTLKKALMSGIVPSSTSIIWYTDSTNLVAFWEKGSPKPDIQLDIIECFLFCREHNIELHVLHLLRSDPRIEAADQGSRYFDKDDWGIDDASFSVIQSRFMPEGFSLDLFASPSNARCSRFFSKYAFPGSSATDAFSVSWNNECLFVCPPIGKLISAWKKISLSSNAKGAVILPIWKSASFWPIFFPDGKHSTWPAISVQPFDPFIKLGQFYAGVMNGHNNYHFVSVFFDTSVPSVPSSNLCHLVKCTCF